jgi:signal transduction histidine kinase
VSYTNLPPGAYTFRVKAAGSEGVWNERSAAALRITILPPWWLTWWAYAGYGFAAVGLLYGFRQYTVNRERLKNDLKLQRLEAGKLQELDTLRARFFANISHEFRTPLTLIIAPLENLLASPEAAGHHPLYETMLRNGRRLLHLINQLLDRRAPAGTGTGKSHRLSQGPGSVFYLPGPEPAHIFRGPLSRKHPLCPV